MSGTKEGGLKARNTNYEKHGEDFYQRIGRKGGQNGHTGGFYGNPELAKRAGAKGGSVSSRAGVRNGEGKEKWKRKWYNTKKVIRDGKEVTLINVKYIPSN